MVDGKLLTIKGIDTVNTPILGIYTSPTTPNNSSLLIKGDTQIDISSDTNNIWGIRTDAQQGSLDMEGSLNIEMRSKSGQAVGLIAKNQSSINITGSKIVLDVHSGTGVGMACELGPGTEVSLNANDIVLSVTADKTSNNWVTGIYNNLGTLNFNGNTPLIAKGGASNYTDVIRTEGDLTDETLFNFNGHKTTLVGISGGHVYGMTMSGVTTAANFSSKEVLIDVSSTNGVAYGISTQYGGQVNFLDPSTVITINAKSEIDSVGIVNTNYGDKDSTVQFGSVTANGTVIINAEGAGHVAGIVSEPDPDWTTDINTKENAIALNGTTTINVSGTSDSAQVLGIFISNTNNSDTSITVNQAHISANADMGGLAAGVVAQNNGKVTLTGQSSLAISATQGTAIGIQANDQSTVKVSNMTAAVEGKNAVGLDVGTSSNIELSGTNHFVVEGTEDSIGLVLADKADVTVKGETTIIANDALSISALASLNVGNDEASGTEKSRLIVNGSASNEGQINLRNADLVVESSKSEGAQSQLGTITTVGADHSTVSVGAGSYTIESFSGQNKSLIVTDLVNNTGVEVKENTGDLTLEASGSANDQFASADQTLEALSDKINVSNAPAEGFDLVAQEGALSDAATGTLNADGTVSDITVTKNTKLEAYNSIAALSAFQWRHDMNDLTKRMGELRTSPEGVGAWARIYGSEQEHGGIQAKNTSIQVGSDVDVGAGWKVGAAFTYTDGKADHDLGNADNKSYGLGIYGTWFADNGQFVDLIAKYSRMDTDFTADSMTGGFDNNAYSVSAEYGWHVKLGQFAFVEPQAEVTYGQVLGDTFTAGNGVKVEQDDFDAFIGRIGVRAGFHFPDNKGVIYMRASVLHDFEGESSARLSRETARTVSTDLGKWGSARTSTSRTTPTLTWSWRRLRAAKWIRTGVGTSVFVTRSDDRLADGFDVMSAV